MQVMIATDGTIDGESAAELAIRLAGADGSVTVYTMVEVPRDLIDEMRQASAVSEPTELPEVMVEYGGASEQPAAGHWFGDDKLIERYIKGKINGRTAGLAAAFEAAGTNAEVVGEEGDNAAQKILAAAAERNVDVLLIGTHGLGRFDGLLGSTSTKLARRATCSVLLVR